MHEHSSNSSGSQPVTQPVSLAGYLLVASPYMLNPTFARTVILVLQHNQEGAAGIVLNRPAGRSIQELWRQISRELPVVDRSFHLGGPLPGPMLALHRDKELAEYQLPGNLYLATDRSHLEQLVTEPEQAFRLFIGHAGWGRGQLEAEISQGVWMLLPLGGTEVFEDEAQLWPRSIRRVGRRVLESAIPSRLIPPDPSVN